MVLRSAQPLNNSIRDNAVRGAQISLFLERIDRLRCEVAHHQAPERKSALGQYFTPIPVAQLMAAMFGREDPKPHILDAGAGVGVLFAAGVAELCGRTCVPARIRVTAYEVDVTLSSYLQAVMDACQELCAQVDVEFEGHVVLADFIESAVGMLHGNLFSAVERPQFSCAILNPPYQKIHSQSRERKLLRQLGIETSNLYTGFLSAAIRLLEPNGELIAITPRSFCNGPYFQSFRKLLLHDMALQRFHVFDSRQEAFRDDEILQENIIMHACKTRAKPERIQITTSIGADDEMLSRHSAAYEQVVHPTDPHAFIHIIPDALGERVTEWIAENTATLEELDLSISTGRVVDFRVREHLCPRPTNNTAPLIYPAHFHDGGITWPRFDSRKPNALAVTDHTRPMLVPSGYYVLVRRFSSKEERRRIVAVVLDPTSAPGEALALENHLNYFHSHGKGLEPAMARGLAIYLNSTLVDRHFRQFNGHTQVNASDLRSLRYPTRAQLLRLGDRQTISGMKQEAFDSAIEEVLMESNEPSGTHPIHVQRKIEEAQAILKSLGFPAAQHNERSALTLLALLDLSPDIPWAQARDVMKGITPLMEFMSLHYGKTYAPNTRETVRRQTVHQFLDAGLILINPDDPSRPTNSGNTVYQIEPGALGLLRSYGSDAWETNLQAYLSSIQTLREKYAQVRAQTRIPIIIAPGKELSLSPGGQNILIEQIIHEFGARFAAGGRVLYVGDTDEKFAYFDEDGLAKLGVRIEPHGKMPDVILYLPKQQWLMLIEAVTSHGPINPKRKIELEQLFAGTQVTLVYITAFLDRRTMAKYLSEISWESEVWVAESPEHLIHFDGDRFIHPHTLEHD